MKKLTIAVVIFGAALAGCAGPRPDAPPSAGVTSPASWRDRPGAATVNASDWWRTFNDPALSALVERALANNTDIATAAARVEEARAGYRAAQGAVLPAINATGGVTLGRSISTATGRPVTQTAGQADLQLAYEVDLFGRLHNTRGAGRATLLASEYARDTVRLSIAATVASGYVTLRALDARLVLLRETVRTREQSLAFARHRADAGYSPALERQQAQAEYDAARLQIPAVELAIRRQEDALSLLLGDTPHAIDRGHDLEQMTTADVSPGLPSALLRQRPDIGQAESQLVAADRSLDAARAAFLPTLRLTASGGYVGSDLLPRDYDVFSLGAGIVQPVFQGGRLRAQTDAAAARRDQAAFQYKRAALNAFREVEDALAGIAQANMQITISREQVATLSETLRLAQNRYRGGYSPYLEEIDAQRALLSARQGLLQAQTDRLTSEIALYQALGGGMAQSGN